MASDTAVDNIRELSATDQLIREFPNVDPTTIQACYEQVIRQQIHIANTTSCSIDIKAFYIVLIFYFSLFTCINILLIFNVKNMLVKDGAREIELLFAVFKSVTISIVCPVLFGILNYITVLNFHA